MELWRVPAVAALLLLGTGAREMGPFLFEVLAPSFFAPRPEGPKRPFGALRARRARKKKGRDQDSERMGFSFS